MFSRSLGGRLQFDQRGFQPLADCEQLAPDQRPILVVSIGTVGNVAQGSQGLQQV